MHHNSSDLHVALTIFCLAAPADSRFAALDCTREVRTHKSSLAPLKRRPVSDLLLRTAPWNRSSASLGCPLIQIGPRRQKATIQRKSRRVKFLDASAPIKQAEWEGLNVGRAPVALLFCEHTCPDSCSKPITLTALGTKNGLNWPSVRAPALSSKKRRQIPLGRGELSRAPAGRSSRPLTALPVPHNGTGNEAKRSAVELRSLAALVFGSSPHDERSNTPASRE